MTAPCNNINNKRVFAWHTRFMSGIVAFLSYVISYCIPVLVIATLLFMNWAYHWHAYSWGYCHNGATVFRFFIPRLCISNLHVGVNSHFIIKGAIPYMDEMVVAKSSRCLNFAVVTDSWFTSKGNDRKYELGEGWGQTAIHVYCLSHFFAFKKQNNNDKVRFGRVVLQLLHLGLMK